MEGENTLVRRFCEQFKCSPGEFENKVFWQCLYPMATPLAWCLWFIRRDIFQPDLELVERIKEGRSFSEVCHLINFYSSQPRQRNYLRLLLKVRMSKRRLQNLARELFSTPGE